MRVEGERRCGPDAAALWSVLSDPERLGEALPGVDSVDVESPERFSASVRPVTGLGVTPVHLAFTVRDRREREHVRIEGRGRTGENAVDVGVEFDLLPEGGGTAVRWRSDFQVLGVLGAVAQRTLPGLVAEQVDALLAEAERQAGGQPGAEHTTRLVTGAQPAPGPGTAGTVAGLSEVAASEAPSLRRTSAPLGPTGTPGELVESAPHGHEIGADRAEEVAGAGADDGDVADPDRYKGGGGR